MEKKAILVVSIGTSQIEALENTTIRLAEEMQERFPEYAYYTAFSSQYILEKIKKQSGLKLFSISEALKQITADGIGEVFVQPTHLLRGLETDKLEKQITKYQVSENEVDLTSYNVSDKGIKKDIKSLILKIHIGTPLLTTKEDHINTLRVILDEVELEEDEALVLIGHGTTHSANNTYEYLEHTAYVQGYRNVFVGTMEGGKSQRMTLQKLAASGYKKVCLMPLLFVAGYHAKKDILAESGSWKQILKEAGYEVRPVMKGLGEYKGIRDVFIQHLGI